MLIEISGKQLDELERRVAIAQSCVWAASEDLSESSPYAAAGLVYSFCELRELVEQLRKQEAELPRRCG